MESNSPTLTGLSWLCKSCVCACMWVRVCVCARSRACEGQIFITFHLFFFFFWTASSSTWNLPVLLLSGQQSLGSLLSAPPQALELQISTDTPSLNMGARDSNSGPPSCRALYSPSHLLNICIKRKPRDYPSKLFRAGEMVHWPRARIHLGEDPGLVLSTHISSSLRNSSFMGSNTLWPLCGHLPAFDAYKLTQPHIHIHNKK